MITSADISVIIPTRDRAHCLGRALESVLAQTAPPDEIIVIDDGSTDDTPTLVSGYSGVRFVRQPTAGVSSARNRGIRETRCGWLAFLDSDDTWEPAKLQQQCDALTARPGFLVCHTDEVWIRHGRRVNAMNKHAKHGGMIFDKCLPRCVISPSSVMIHRRLFDLVGTFDEDLPACEDYDLWLRICARYPVLYIEDRLITKYGGHDDQLSRRFRAMDRFRLRALEKILDEGDLYDADARAARETLLEKADILIRGARRHGNHDLAQRCETLRSRFAVHPPGGVQT
ncbi:MAG: glycosyltransferase [Pseudomonadota bacterium]|nr:glycosyltransferase [Pseudomonadota bacterium]